MTLAERWSALWTALHLSMPEDAHANRILGRYAEPHRAYHTLQHLEECLGWLDEARHSADQPASVTHHPGQRRIEPRISRRSRPRGRERRQT